MQVRRRPPDAYWWARGILALLIALSTAPLLRTWGGWPTTTDPDAAKNLMALATLRDAVWHFGEWPLWNPFVGGGLPWAGYVYNRGLAPQSLLMLAAGELHGLMLWILAIQTLGVVGMFITLRGWLGTRVPAALLGAALFGLTSWLPGTLADGDYDLIAFHLLPFLAASFLALVRGRAMGVWAPVVLLAALADAGKHWPFLMAGAVLALALVQADVADVTRRRILIRWAQMVGVALLLAAPKLLPLVQLFRADLVDHVAGREWIEFPSIIAVLRSLAGVSTEAGPLHMGIVPFVLAAAAVVLTPRRAVGIAVLTMAVVLFGAGTQAPVPLVDWLTRVPGLNTLGNPGLYAAVPLLAGLCALAALGFEALVSAGLRWRAERWRWRWFQVAAAAVALVAVLPLARRNEVAYQLLFTRPEPPVSRSPYVHVAYAPEIGVAGQYRDGITYLADGNEYENLRRGIDTVTWYGNVVLPESVAPDVVLGRNGEVLCDTRGRALAACEEPGESCRVDGAGVTYNTVVMHPRVDHPAWVVVNMNCHAQWTSDDAVVGCRDGRLAAWVTPASPWLVRLRFVDPYFEAGFGLMGLGVACLAGGWARTRRRGAGGPA